MRNYYPRLSAAELREQAERLEAKFRAAWDAPTNPVLQAKIDKANAEKARMIEELRAQHAGKEGA